ncbi:hypothetical protein [Ruicaihuangia caeni]|uniref:Lipoprotein with Yx(FWY)xxD motif n=1 Tax=Ruicaihuangia caeni TaxID=3042517 RepID=A0AAW6T5T0_9MICO|nr:hypothetical protein [Klugiella sp. YN-L-19]MDI2099185.1 hypothetical protein [Klugiella sp. YN-L-19]
MKLRVAAGAVAIASILALTGCGGIGEPGNDMTAPTGTPSPQDTNRNYESVDREPITELKTTDSSHGEVVVDNNGMVVYMTDLDEAGSSDSNCDDKCLVEWIPVPEGDTPPELNGVSGELGTIESNADVTQVTLNGMPLYYYVRDTQPGDTAGQGNAGVWWLVGPDGEKVKG